MAIRNSPALRSIWNRVATILRPLEPVIFWSAQLVFAAERWQQQFGPQIRGWLAAVGEFEPSARFPATRSSTLRMYFRTFSDRTPYSMRSRLPIPCYP